MSLFENKVECNNGTFDISNGAVAPCVNSGGVKAPKSKFDFSGLSKILNGGGLPDLSIDMNKKPTKVLCNDGSIQLQTNDLNAKVMDACAKNGGKSANQPIDFIKYEQDQYNLEKAKYNANLPTKGKEDITKKLLGAYNQNLIILVVLVAGYFAYKKFKK